MKIFILLTPLLASSILILSGCSYSYPVTFERMDGKTDTLTFMTVNRRLSGRDAFIHFMDGRERHASRITLTPDSCRFFNEEKESWEAEPVSDLLTISRTDHLSGAVGGMVVGGLGGAALGFGIGAVQTSASTEGRGWRAVYAVGGGLIGALSGLFVGAVAGTQSEYQLQPRVEAQDRFLSVPADTSRPTALAGVRR